MVQGLMVRAGQDLLKGFELKVDQMIVRSPDRLLTEGSTQGRWQWLLGHLQPGSQPARGAAREQQRV